MYRPVLKALGVNDIVKGVLGVASTHQKITPRALRTLAFGLLLPIFTWFELKALITAAIPRASMNGLLHLVCFAAMTCAISWIMIRPTEIRWVHWPWWSFVLLGVGFLARALVASRTTPWQHVTINLLFFLFAVGIQEEFIFRGCIEEGLRDLGSLPAILSSGLLFGLAHAPVNFFGGESLATAILSSLGMGVPMHLVFRWLRDRGGLLFSALAHGLLDFLGPS